MANRAMVLRMQFPMRDRRVDSVAGDAIPGIDVRAPKAGAEATFTTRAPLRGHRPRLVRPAWAITNSMKGDYRNKVTKNRSEAQAAEGDRSGEGSVEQRHDRTERNRQRGRARAISMLANAKSNESPKDASSRAGRHGPKVIAPYPGRPRAARAVRGVSRGRSSEEGGESRPSEGPKTGETD